MEPTWILAPEGLAALNAVRNRMEDDMMHLDLQIRQYVPLASSPLSGVALTVHPPEWWQRLDSRRSPTPGMMPLTVLSPS